MVDLEIGLSSEDIAVRDTAHKFAEELGLRLEVVVAPSHEAMIPMLLLLSRANPTIIFGANWALISRNSPLSTDCRMISFMS